MATQDNTTPTDDETKKALRVLHEAVWRLESIFRHVLNQDDATASQRIMAESGFLTTLAAQTAFETIRNKVAVDFAPDKMEPRACNRALYSALSKYDLEVLASESMGAPE